MPFNNGEDTGNIERHTRKPLNKFKIAKNMAYRTVPFGLPQFRSIIWMNNGKHMTDKKDGGKQRLNSFAADDKLVYEPLEREFQMKGTPKRADSDPDKVPFGLHDQMQSVFRSIIQQNNEKQEFHRQNGRKVPFKMLATHDNLAYHPSSGQSRIRLVKRPSSLRHKMNITEMKSPLRFDKFYKQNDIEAIQKKLIEIEEAQKREEEDPENKTT